MSGHSKWHNIQIRKGKQDAKKANIFTKGAKLITVAAQKGGDPAMNFSLRLAMDKARAAGLPKENIERALKRGTGELAGAARMEEIYYEAYGPGGVAILIKALTDNKNRTVSDLKHILSVSGGSLGNPGSVAWMFEQVGVIIISKQTTVNRDELELALIEAGAEDISDTEEEVEIKTKIENLPKVLAKLKELNVEVKDSRFRWIAKDRLEPSPEHEDKLAALFAELEAHDDVEDYYTNAE
ncbi:MAG: YebC/PmpR family DNA-binding transcriptional regulator [Candidatus Magasanikbacteria bacterium]|nr:YebC/PmpR family DNA-binding transcriptional regulator [Candidatus Magasanikbacteria bacterium]